MILRTMGRTLRDGAGTLLIGAALAILFWGVVLLRGHDYVASMLLVVAGLSMLRAGAEVLRPTLGE